MLAVAFEPESLDELDELSDDDEEDDEPPSDDEVDELSEDDEPELLGDEPERLSFL